MLHPKSNRVPIAFGLFICFLISVVFALVLRLNSSTSSSEKFHWEQVTAQPNWEPGYAFSVLSFNNKLWIFGKQDGNWTSTDGKEWVRIPFSSDAPRGFNAYAVFRNEIYAVGGTEDRFNIGKKAVWKSKDGIDWTLLTQSPEWPARVWHTGVVHDDKIWLLGGYNNSYINDVWFSSDGRHWQLVTARADWEGRCMHTSVVFENQIWVLGGIRDVERWWDKNFNDVWSSKDGIHWTHATMSAGWSKRNAHTSAVWDGKIWVMGGRRFYTHDDVWFSKDGAKWTKANKAPWSRRFGLASAVFQDKVWIMGGKRGAAKFTNDVWCLVSN